MNVLIVGNGFDRKIGLKTDYASFMTWMKEQGNGVGSRFSSHSKKLHFTFIESPNLNRIGNYKSIKGSNIDFAGEKFNLVNYDTGKYFDETSENQLANSLLYLLPEIVCNNTPSKTVKANIWYCFIQLLLFETEHKLLGLKTSKFLRFLNRESNWVDLEGLIQESIRIRVQDDYFKAGIFSISNYFDVFSLANLLTLDINENHQRQKEEIYELVWTDFLDFKKNLCNYLTPISDKTKNNWTRFETSSLNYCKITGDTNIININNYEKIINFNYTNFWLENPNVYYVHGNIDDRDSIVFGLDMNIREGEFQKDERKTTFEISLHKNKRLLKFSKISQLLHLQVDKISNPLKKIAQLSIVGHSIGEQDYSYYFSILDRNVENIQLNCLWYDYNHGENNKESMEEALFEMLTNYEKYSNQKILHKMIFEGRIKFKKVFIPNIF